MNRNQLSLLSILFVFLVSMTSCEVVGGIFKAGMWTSVIIIVAIVAVVLYLVRGRRR
jgi:hypothetical protein